MSTQVLRIAIVTLLCIAVTSSAPVRAQGPATVTRPSLYERLGGYDGIAAYIALVFPRVAQHPELMHMFRGHGKDSQQRQFQLVVELVCQKTGGPCAYLGRPMPPVHDGLGITEAKWTTFMKIITDGLEEKRYPADVRAEFLQVWRGSGGSAVSNRRTLAVHAAARFFGMLLGGRTPPGAGNVLRLMFSPRRVATLRDVLGSRRTGPGATATSRSDRRCSGRKCPQTPGGDSRLSRRPAKLAHA